MSSLPTPNYLTTEECSFVLNDNIWEKKILPAGTFVRPIDVRWLPNHIKESSSFRWMNDATEVFVYCKFGIILIPIKIVRKA